MCRPGSRVAPCLGFSSCWVSSAVAVRSPTNQVCVQPTAWEAITGLGGKAVRVATFQLPLGMPYCDSIRVGWGNGFVYALLPSSVRQATLLPPLEGAVISMGVKNVCPRSPFEPDIQLCGELCVRVSGQEPSERIPWHGGVCGQGPPLVAVLWSTVLWWCQR